MSPPHYIMCKELIRSAAQAAAAASILVELAKSKASSRSRSGLGAVATPAATASTMPDGNAKDAEASFGRIRALCAAVTLANSTLRFVSLRALHREEAKGGRHEDVVEVEERVSQPESVGLQRSVIISATATLSDDDAAPVVVENVPETAGDAPAWYAYRHARRRRKVPVVAGGGENAPATEARVECSTERRTARIRIVVAGAVAGTCKAAIVAEKSLGVDSDLPPLEDVGDCSTSIAPITVAADTASIDSPNALWTSKEHVAVAVSSEAPEGVTADEPLIQNKL